MDFVFAKETTITLELALVVFEIMILIIILAHMKWMRIEDRLLKQNIRELHKLHLELHQSMELLKEDIKDLQLNNKELKQVIKECELGNLSNNQPKNL